MEPSPLTPLTPSQVTGIVLSGGRGLRMGGIDKPLAMHGGSPMVQQVLERLGPQVGHCILSANRNSEQYQRLAEMTLPEHGPILVVADQLIDYQGPLAGIHSALKHCETPWFFVCPGDAPQLPKHLIDALSPHRNPERACIAQDGERQQPLHFLGHRSLLGALERYLDSGGRSVIGFHEQNAGKTIRVGVPEDFASINSPPNATEENPEVRP